MSWVSQVTEPAVGVLVTAAAGAALVQGRRLVTRAKAQRQDDHRPIGLGAWFVRMPPDGGGDGVRVLIICAPSRTLRGAGFDPSAAIRFVKSHFAQAFPHPPAYSGSQGVRFECNTESSCSDYVWVNASGRVDFSITVPTRQTAAGRVTLDVLDLLRPVAQRVAAVRDPAYWRIFGSQKPPRQPRFDWRIGPSIDNRDRDMNYRVAWEGLSFPGRTPDSRSAEQRPFCPPVGFASDKLTSRGTDEPVEELLQTFLTAFLTEHGYLGIEDAVVDAVNDRPG